MVALAGTEPFSDLFETGGGILVESRVDDLDTARLIALQVNGRRAASGERIADAGQWRDDGVWLLGTAMRRPPQPRPEGSVRR